MEKNKDIRMDQSSSPVDFISLSRANKRMATITAAILVKTAVTTIARFPRAYPSSTPRGIIS